MDKIIPFTNIVDVFNDIIKAHQLKKRGIARRADLSDAHLYRVLGKKMPLTERTKAKLQEVLKMYLPPE